MMATKKDKDFQGITIEVGGEVIGKIKKWDPDSVKPITEKLKTTDYLPGAYSHIAKTVQHGGTTALGMNLISVPMELSDIWGPHLIETSGKSIMGLTALGKLLQPGYLYVRAQLEMWGVEKTKEICVDCAAEIVTTLEDMGYRVWFDEKSSIKEEFAEACGIVVQDFKLEYVGVGEKEDE